MSEPRDKFPVEECEPTYEDYSDPKVVRKLLKDAFQNWQPSEKGRVGRSSMLGKPPQRRGIWWKKQYVCQSKFCYDRVDRLLTYLGIGMFLEQVCALVGVRSKTVNEWIKRGQDPTQGPYYVFARAVEQIGASFEAKQLTNIHTLTFGRDPAGRRYMSAKDSADMSLRMLKAKFPKLWGDRMDVTSDGKPLGEGRPDRVEIAFVDATTATPLGKDDSEE